MHHRHLLRHVSLINLYYIELLFDPFLILLEIFLQRVYSLLIFQLFFNVNSVHGFKFGETPRDIGELISA